MVIGYRLLRGRESRVKSRGSRVESQESRVLFNGYWLLSLLVVTPPTESAGKRDWSRPSDEKSYKSNQILQIFFLKPFKALVFYILRRGGGKERTPKGILANNERSEFVFIFTDVHI